MSFLEKGSILRLLESLNSSNLQQVYTDINHLIYDRISIEEIGELYSRLNTLIGVSIPVLNVPGPVLSGFEPSQIGTIVGTLMDACIPQLDIILKESNIIEDIGLEKHEGIIGEREAYPDYRTVDGYRLELKLLYVDPFDIQMKKPPTPREASARLTQKVTYKNVDTNKDLLLVIAYQFQRTTNHNFSPTIIGVGLFPVIDCILARDIRLAEANGRWFGYFETPAILSRSGKESVRNNTPLNIQNYGRKESEGYDFNEDTNFGKLARIPYLPLQQFLKHHNAKYATRGIYPNQWRI